MLNIESIVNGPGNQTDSILTKLKSLPALFDFVMKHGVHCIDVRRLTKNTMAMSEMFQQLKEIQKGHLFPHQYKQMTFQDEDGELVDVHPQERVNAWIIAATDWEGIS